MRSKLYSIIISALLGVLLVCAQTSLMLIPGVELVTLLCIIYTRTLRWRALPPIIIYVMLEGLIFFGFGSLWWISYIYVWPLLWCAVMIVPRSSGAAVYALISGIFGLSFGFLCSLPYLFTGGLSFAFSYWINGILFDAVHGIFNFIIALALINPVHRAFKYVYSNSPGNMK